MPHESKFQAKASADGDTLDLLMYGYIGEDFWGDGSAVDCKVVAKSLAEAKSAKNINCRINTGGGDAFHALAIYQSLKNHPATVKIMIDGICASAGAVIAMAGDEIVMNEAGLMMIHQTSGSCFGTMDELQIVMDLVQKLDESQVTIFASRTGLKADEIKSMLEAETWMSGKEAKAKGFVTSLSSAKAVAAEFRAETFHNVPARLQSKLANLLVKEPNSMATQSTETTPTVPEQQSAQTPSTPATPQQTATAPPAPPAAPAVDAVAVATQRAADITSACVLAGKAEMASKFIQDPNATLQVVLHQLQSTMCQERKPLGDGGSGGDPAPANPNAKFEQEFESNKSLYAEMNLTKEAYVRGRRIDEGLESLPMKTRA